MGYEVYITKKKNWYDEDGDEISPEDWQNAVEHDPQMEIVGETIAPVGKDGVKISYKSPLLAEWKNPDSGETVWFDYSHGNIVVKSPDEATKKKIKSIASIIGAKAQGEEGKKI